ncbi:AMP-dependent synthetase [Kosakonia sp. R1.Fl]|uniref:AMP-dependent synthetase n=1 Tax=Kosakonia sp. R1.Fl TaxID=2928706 RepID=UPI00201DA00E|nr:AMP-dependent synthetase [Kosakonia sp. R1.Fl]MCL6742984.1 AMP-dependent synthetase [Kosakonia sp. R1.Fl]
MKTLPFADWLSHSRANDTPIAWLGVRTWTLEDLRSDVAQLMTWLQTQDDERWALCFENSYLFIVALLATLHAGKTPVIPGHCRESLLAEQKTLFQGVLSDQSLRWEGPHCVVKANAPHAAKDPVFPPLREGAFIELFTSGSTGQPRRVIKPIACLDREATLLAARFSDQLAGCRVVASVVPQHLYGLTFRIFLPMSLGLPLHAAMLYYAEQLAALESHHRYAFISSPAFLKRLDPRLAPPPMAIILSAGGMLPWTDVQGTADWCGVQPDEIYGSTETGILAWRHRQHDSIPWKPFPGVSIVPEGEAFRAHSPIIPEPDGLLLDDILLFNDGGTFHIAGRRGRVVKIEEKRISLSEIERRVLALEGIRDAAALPVSRGGRQGVGVLLVLEEEAHRQWLNCDSKAMELAWRRALIPWLEPVAVPRYWRILEEIPVNSMNKRVYAQLQELFHETS